MPEHSYHSSCPYKGLVPYSIEDAEFFFGREKEKEIITANLVASRLTLLYGPGGVGKSSILRAGVANQLLALSEQDLAQQGRLGSAVVVFNSWRDDPLTSLIWLVNDSISRLLNNKDIKPSPNSRTLAQALHAYTESFGGDLLIILDQFEEYFLYHAAEDGEGTFAIEFPRAVNRSDLRANFLISIREDSLAKLDRFKGRIPNLFDNYLRIEHLDRQAARAAIESPIKKYNLLHPAVEERFGIEPELVEAILNEVETGRVVLGEAGRGAVKAESTSTQIETPFLQLVMMRLWNEERRVGSRVLRLETLNKLGGAERIVRTHLDEVMSTLLPAEQEISARIFRYLVTPSRTKIAYTPADLALLSEVDEAEIARVLEKLSDGDVRILRVVAPPPDTMSDSRYEIFHDVLASAILDWRARYAEKQAQDQIRREAKEERERAQAIDRARRLRQLVVGLLVVTLVMAGLTAFAFQQGRVAERALSETTVQKAIAEEEASKALRAKGEAEAAQVYAEQSRDEAEKQKQIAQKASYETIQALKEANAQRARAQMAEARAVELQRAATSRELAANSDLQFQSDPQLGLLLAIEAVKVSPTEQAENALRQSLLQSGEHTLLDGKLGRAGSIAFSRDGRLIATTYTTTKVWDAQTGRMVIELKDGKDSMDSANFSPDGEYIVTITKNTAKVWEVRTGHLVTEYGEDSRDWISNANFSPDGKLVVTGCSDGTATVWDAKTGKTLIELDVGTNDVNVANFSPDGKLIMTVDGNRVRLWEVETRRPLIVFKEDRGRVNVANFSPDGKLIVTGSSSVARVWDAQTGHSIVELRGHAGEVNSAVFSPDRMLIATASEDGTTRIWNANTGRNLAELKDTAAVSSAVFTPDGKFVITTNDYL